MIFNTVAASSGGGGSSQGWTNVSEAETASGSGELAVLTDGHLVYVCALNVAPDDNGYLVTGLPISTRLVATKVILNEGLDSFGISAILDGDSIVIDGEYFNPEEMTLMTTTFTILYPIS